MEVSKMAGMNYAAVEQFSYPVLDQQIVEELYVPQVFRQFFEQIHLPEDEIYQVPFEDGDTTFRVNRIGEGAQCKIEEIQYEDRIAKTYKIGEGFYITDEEVRFSKIASVAFKPRKLGFKIGNTIDFDCMSVIDAAIPANHIITATGQTTGLDNTVATIANYVGHHDYTRAKMVIRRDGQVQPTDCVMSAAAFEFLERLPQYGTAFYADGAYYTSGRRPLMWEGMRVHVSEQIQNLPNPNTIFIISTGLTSSSGQYAPMGKYVYNYDIRTESRFNPAKDQNEIYAYAKYVPLVLKGDHLAKITWTSPYP
jgi:hypothetical protein